MMRFLPWLPLLALLAIVAPVAQKGVIESDCDAYGCEEAGRLIVNYRLLGLAAREPLPGEAPEVPSSWHGAPHWYKDPIPHPDGQTPLLLWGSVATVLGAPIVAGLLWSWRRCPDPRRHRTALVGFAMWAGGQATFAMGVIVHSATWRGLEVTLLHPHVGAVMLAASLVSGLALRQEEPDVALPSLPPPARETPARVTARGMPPRRAAKV